MIGKRATKNALNGGEKDATIARYTKIFEDLKSRFIAGRVRRIELVSIRVLDILEDLSKYSLSPVIQFSK